VATGTGLVLFRLAEAVGPGGFAAGLDFTPAMLEQAAARRAGVSGTESPAGRPALLAADAVRLPFTPGRFDVVTCRFAVHHMSDPEAGLAAMAAALRPGGRLGIADFLRPEDAAEGERHDQLERLRGHVYGRIYERTSLERSMAAAGCPVREARVIERSVDPRDWLGLSHLSAEDREALAALVDGITARGSGAGLEVRRDGGDVRFVRSDVVLLGVKDG
jgi:SAM-dependent methyltransferase